MAGPTILNLSPELEFTAGQRRALEGLGSYRAAPRRPATVAEAVDLLSEVDFALMPPLRDGPMSTAEFASLECLRGLALSTTQSSWIDLAAAEVAGVSVVPLGGYSTGAVAEYAVACTLMLCRQLPAAARAAAGGSRDFRPFEGREFSDTTVGVVGQGRVGRRVADILVGLGFTVIGWNRTDRQSSVGLVPLPEVFARSDVAVVTVATTAQTRGMVGSSLLSRMKPGSALVSISGEEVVDQEAVYDALLRRGLAGYAFEFDYSEGAPVSDVHQRLVALPAVVGTPHIAWYTGPSQERMLAALVDNTQALVRGTP